MNEKRAKDGLRSIQNLVSEWQKSLGPKTRAQVPVEFVNFQVLERVFQNVKTIEFLFARRREFHHALALLQRNILTDFILMAYLSIDMKDVGTKEKRYFSLLKDDINKTKSSLEKTPTDIDFFNEHELVKQINRICEEEEIKTIRSTGVLVMEMLKVKADHNVTITEAFDSWTYFSKFEHLGLMSYFVKSNTSEDVFLKELGTVIRLSFWLIGNSFEEIGEVELKEKAYNLYLEFRTSN
ncbi:hypothetical protein [Arcticibacterium luteifluviistationis]|uniref:Uncharacterized protein n=1 Tax=Arcticibacterium luteifluviistationis TaxID=1784714 RepID=A0A2Z4GAL8_9BACT|nr:hypothetical protein [Arcticibacterium luteifluviistationis]AWV98309.1 hypothetical protein DJ013_09050 [Arcticibacterium luteifluviistationis]